MNVASRGSSHVGIDRESEETTARLLTHLDARERLAIVKAPPGSGKTWLLLKAVAHALGRNARVAVGTQTNAQADDICRRLARDYPHVDTFRFAAGGAAPAPLGRSVHWATSEGQLPTGACAVVGTVAKWSMIELHSPFDVLFVDEAWQMAWADFMLCGQVAARFVLIGDPGQIPPVVSIPVQRWETSPRAPHLPAPDVIWKDPQIPRLLLTLPASRRLPYDAVHLVRRFYDFHFDAWAEPGERFVRLTAASRRQDPLDRTLELLDGGSVAALAVSTPTGGPPLEQDDELARTIARIAGRLLDRGAAAGDGNGKPAQVRPEDIGIAATHRVMNSAIVRSLPAALRNKTRVDTPERWQGLECKVMIVAHPLSGVVHPSAFDLETGRLCVMASRHRSGLILVSRDHVPETLETHIPSAEQAVGRPDITGRGHAQHLEFWSSIRNAERLGHLH